MRSLVHIIAAGLVAAASPGAQAFAQASSSQTTVGSGTVFQPIVLAKTSDLSFGTVIRPLSGSDVITIAPASGARSQSSGAAGLMAGGVPAPDRAAYTVSGEGGQTFSISVPASLSMTRSGGAETLAVTLSATATSGTLSGGLGAPGTAAFGVGGSIPVAAATTTGAYAGSFSVTVAYN